MFLIMSLPPAPTSTICCLFILHVPPRDARLIDSAEPDGKVGGSSLSLLLSAIQRIPDTLQGRMHGSVNAGSSFLIHFLILAGAHPVRSS